MKFASLCSGIEAATVALQPLGFDPVFYAEIDKNTNHFLRTRFPHTPNYGDIRSFENWPHHDLDLIIGGTPCQSFSLNGNREGLQDARGQLSESFFRVIGKYKPKWVIWENVAAVLSSNGGRDFGSFLGSMAKLGYGTAYRVLDSQHFGVPQRRRRIYVVGYLGCWKGAAKVLFEPDSVFGHPPAKCATPETIAKCLTTSTGRRDTETETFIVDDFGVRRLLPVEAERLMGFPDNWTNIRKASSKFMTDRFRYKAIGNSMTVPVVRWIGSRILGTENK